MSKVTKSERITQLEQIAADQGRAFKIMADRLKSIEVESKWIIHMTGIERPQLKQLDQSVFDGLDEKWRFAAVDSDTSVYTYEARQHIEDNRYWVSDFGMQKYIGTGYDASNWQNSLIERESKELLEVDLSSELTGSDLCRAMLARGDKYVMCLVSMADDETALSSEAVTLNRIMISLDKEWLYTDTGTRWHYAVPINNQGEPLTAKDVGL